MNSFHSTLKIKIFVSIIIILCLLVFYLVLFATRIDPQQQMAQKIFYYHVPSAWTAGLSYLFVAMFGLIYLLKKDEKWDYFSYASAEIGTLFCALVLITGPIWAKPIWGSAWSWEPRLTTVLIMFLIYVGYFLLRNFGEVNERMRRISAVIGILAFANVPIIYLSVKFWNQEAQLHPQPAMGSQPDDVYWTFILSLISFTLLSIYLFSYRVHVLRLKAKLFSDRYDL